MNNGKVSLSWAGYEWNLKSATKTSPGWNDWDPNNIWIDDKNRLHLKLKKSPTTGRWTSAEIYSCEKFGFGTFKWFIEGPLDRLDPNIVFGLFIYGGQDGSNEIDIEFAKWSNDRPEASNLFFTTYPNQLEGGPQDFNDAKFSLQGTYTTHQFTWTPSQVFFRSQQDFQRDSTANTVASHVTPQEFSSLIPTVNLPLHMNLWCFQGRSPTNDQEVEIIIHDFKFTKHTRILARETTQ